MMTGIMQRWSLQFNQRFPFDTWTCLICQLLPLLFYPPLGGFVLGKSSVPRGLFLQLHVQLLQLSALHSQLLFRVLLVILPPAVFLPQLDLQLLIRHLPMSVVQRTPQLVNLPLERLSGCFPAVAGWPAMLRRAISVLCCSSYLP